MGIQPFEIPRRAPPPQENREDKVMQLARMLHQRGITASLTDAKRLAEGMVQVERRVINQPKSEPLPTLAADIPAESGTSDFGEFVQETIAQHPAEAEPKTPVRAAAPASHVATMTPASHAPRSETTPNIPKTIVYGRSEPVRMAEVPHTTARKQTFYEDAPDWTKLRGYSGPKPGNATYQTQEILAKRDMTQARPAPTWSNAASVPAARQAPATPAAQPAAPPTPRPAEQVTRVEVNEGAVKVTRAASTPTTEVVEEHLIVEDVGNDLGIEVVEPTRPIEAPKAQAQRTPHVEAPIPQSPPRQEERKEEQPVKKELQPGDIDLFNFFKKK
jgi:hypothetical protein